MNELQVEERTIDGNTSLSADLAKHIISRLDFGSLVVVAKQPAVLVASVRKQWLVAVRHLQRERASTLNAENIRLLTQQIALLQHVRFSADYADENVPAMVQFATVAQLIETAPICHTMYITTPTERETLHKITSFMFPKSLVVVYGLPPAASEARG